MSSTRLDFTALRRRARFGTVLDHYGLKPTGTGVQRFILCPFHQETTASCSIHLAKQIFHCFGCDAKGTIIDFVAMMERINLQAAAITLSAICEIEKPCSGPSVQSDRSIQYRKLGRRDPNPPLARPLSLNPIH